MKFLERRRDEIVKSYNIIAQNILCKGSPLNNKEISSIGDVIGNKVTEICGYVKFIDRNNPDCNYKKMAILHEKETLKLMSNLQEKYSILLKDLDLDFFECNSLEEIDKHYSKLGIKNFSHISLKETNPERNNKPFFENNDIELF